MFVNVVTNERFKLALSTAGKTPVRLEVDVLIPVWQHATCAAHVCWWALLLVVNAMSGSGKATRRGAKVKIASICRCHRV
jgi:hypothetical protein